ncbi:MAG: helix-turn-helix domain-containing protein, partial [Pseudomonadota bacterium]
MTIDSRDNVITYKAMDSIFKALADPARRDILDALRAKDGQTLSQIGTRFEMTRFGVMKHLGVLEAAGLITTVKRGRFKYHYLNALPLQEALDRWIAPFAKPVARAVLDLKAKLEAAEATQTVTMSVFIAAPAGKIWDALTDPAALAASHDRADDVRRDGAALTFSAANTPFLRLEEVAHEVGKTRHARFVPLSPTAAASEVTFTIVEEGAHCVLSLEHRGLSAALAHVPDSWRRSLAGLKTL